MEKCNYFININKEQDSDLFYFFHRSLQLQQGEFNRKLRLHPPLGEQQWAWSAVQSPREGGRASHTPNESGARPEGAEERGARWFAGHCQGKTTRGHPRGKFHWQWWWWGMSALVDLTSLTWSVSSNVWAAQFHTPKTEMMFRNDKISRKYTSQIQLFSITSSSHWIFNWRITGFLMIREIKENLINYES